MNTTAKVIKLASQHGPDESNTVTLEELSASMDIADVDAFRNTQAASCTVLKRDQTHELQSDCQYQFDVLHDRTDDPTEAIQLRALRIIKQAEKEAERLKQTAIEEGRDAGFDQGLRDAKETIETRAAELAAVQIAQDSQSLQTALTDACKQAQADFEQWQTRWDMMAFELVTHLAEKVTRRQLRADPEIAKSIMADVLRLAIGSRRLSVRLNPLDLELLGDQAADFAEGITGCETIEWLEEATIQRGGCVVETEQGAIDARLETLFERLQEELLS
ncbi:MAG: hypothetical protein CMJ78_25510 [Planctomycetaceae bacterium]|nr:hypothetical protein [Planctomycetaceae bacterium]